MLKAFLFFAALAPASAAAQGKPGAPAGAPCPAATICIERSGADYRFRFDYPAAAPRLPALQAMLEAEAAREEAELAAIAASEPVTVPLRYQGSYRLDAELPELIALSGPENSDGAVRERSLLYDPRNGERLQLIDLFQPETFDTNLFWSPVRGIRAVQQSFCSALTGAVRARRGEPDYKIVCPNVEEQTVAMTCNGRGRILGMRATVGLTATRAVDPDAPAEYRVSFPVSAEMIGTMKRRYRVAFGVPGERGRNRTCLPVAAGGRDG